MDSKRKFMYLTINLREMSTLRVRPKTDGGTVYKQILINANSQIGKRGQKTKMTGRSPLTLWPWNWTFK